MGLSAGSERGRIGLLGACLTALGACRRGERRQRQLGVVVVYGFSVLVLTMVAVVL